MKYGLSLDSITKINSIFEKFSKIEEVILYGSRAKGDYRYNSDIDLTIKGKDLDVDMLYRVKTLLDDLLLPYTIDICIYDDIDNSHLKEHIDTVAKSFYEKESVKAF